MPEPGGTGRDGRTAAPRPPVLGLGRVLVGGAGTVPVHGGQTVTGMCLKSAVTKLVYFK